MVPSFVVIIADRRISVNSYYTRCLFYACAAIAVSVCAMADSNTVEKTVEQVAIPENLNDSLLIVKGERAAGSGFVCTVDGRQYIISNLHVVSANEMNTFTTVNGSVLTVSNLEVSAGADLCRMLVSSGNCQGLSLSSKQTKIGDAVTVYGNSQGANVATKLTGTVCGVGPDLVEVTAQFVQGNSGSPILDAQGEVLGVATFVQRGSADWVSTNTQFSAVRRYGVRLSSAMAGTWLPVPQSQVYQQNSLLNDLELMGIHAYMDLGQWSGNLKKEKVEALMRDAHIASAFQREAYVEPKWFDAVEKALTQIQQANDLLKEKVSKHDSRVTTAVEGFKRAMQKINKEPMQLCDKTPWVKTKLITDRVKDLRALYTPMGKDIDELWDRIQKVLNSTTSVRK